MIWLTLVLAGDWALPVSLLAMLGLIASYLIGVADGRAIERRNKQ